MFLETVQYATFFERRTLILYSFNLNVVVFDYVELEYSKVLHLLRHYTVLRTRRFRKRNWVALMIVNISELDKGNGELYMQHGNLDIPMVYFRFSFK